MRGEPIGMVMPRRVNVEEAKNGYLVRGYDEKGKEIQLVCTSLDEAHTYVKELLGKKKESKKVPVKVGKPEMMAGMKKRMAKKE